MNYTGALQAVLVILLAGWVICDSNFEARITKLTESHRRATRGTEGKTWSNFKSIIKRAAEQVQKITDKKADVPHKRVRRMGFPIPGVMSPWLQQQAPTPPSYYSNKKPNTDNSLDSCDCTDYYYYEHDELPEGEGEGKGDSTYYYYDEECYDYCLEQYREGRYWEEYDAEGTGDETEHP